MTAWELGRRPALDGVRGVAILMVLFGHLTVWPLSKVHVEGVEVFFVLSGFLITSLLVEEAASTNRVGLARFYLRRVRRLLPALALLLVGMLVAARFGYFDSVDMWEMVKRGGGYTANFARVRGETLGPLEHLWSLAVEEQFYVLFPPVVAVLAARRRLPWLGVAIAIGMTASFLMRLVTLSDSARLYNGTDTRALPMLAGCLLAVAIRDERVRTALRRTSTAAMLAASAVVVIAVSGWGDRFGEPVQFLVAMPIATVAIAHVLAGVLIEPDGTAARILAARPLRLAGELSYAMYLWHYPIIKYFGNAGQVPPARAVAVVGLTVVAAFVSMIVVEAPALGRTPELVGAVQRRLRLPTLPWAQPAPAGNELVDGGPSRPPT